MKYRQPISFLLILISFSFFLYRESSNEPINTIAVIDSANCWTGASPHQIPVDSSGSLIRYGYLLISNTAAFLGPNGTVSHSTNGMNCQNCHLEAGTKPWGNNYGAVASTYPKVRARSGKLESIEMRVNDCLQRSLNGKPIDSLSKEMLSIVAYIKWLGSEIPKGEKPKGTGIIDLPYLTRAADTIQGRKDYIISCASCHGIDGKGKTALNGIGFLYPPLWGNQSYNDAAGIFRLSRFAGFIKNNMPNPSNYHHTKLSNESAWDIAAYVNSQPRPHKDQSQDWPDISKKPVDCPIGPYTDKRSEKQHKYGPYTLTIK
ncbi:MAG: c-type cytochrome [Bacteroidetes bacterium]|nr:c-type cytochrome [Bacteroidota bacterium]